ncbi:KR-domain-containing protein [Colletotrichum zoysiae]|uniref:KR-domain-containing protein n=1 Tax=Colletotrichum zoysiae TaxID=1216348 RepID=A0AAD9H1P0_9PEZI|nr:KR-domain-containing protein [Colletotrichum zoysiae]
MKAGMIIRAGKLAADHRLGIGDWVCFLIAGSRWASSMRVHYAHVARIPEHVPFSAAANLAPGYVTVHLALQDVARSSSGERVLIHGSMAVMGRAAIEYGSVRGLLVYLAAEDVAKKKKLEDELGLTGAGSTGTVLNCGEGSIVQQIWAATGQEGVDVIISPCRSFVEQSSECLRDFARVIELMLLVSLLGYRPCVEDIPISQSAHALHDNNMNSPPEHGREAPLLALTVGDVDIVSADASYLLVGGAGGVGRSLCEWAIARGARHRVVMGRSARSGDEFLAELTGSCNVRVVKCDVSDQDQLAAVACAASADMPPIRGIF